MEDLEEVLSNSIGVQLLRAVLWGEENADGSMKREVSWTSSIMEKNDYEGIPERFDFEAGIIMTANKFPNDVTFSSLLTRVAPVRFDVEPAEVFAFMREVAREGVKVYDGSKHEIVTIPEDECRVVIEFLEAKETTNLRLLKHALSIYNRFREDGWRELVATVIAGGLPDSSPGTRTSPACRANGKSVRQQRREYEQRVVSELLARDDLPASERITLFCEQTGSSRASFFRRQRDLRGG